MANAYSQVALTYVRRMLSARALAFGLLIGVSLTAGQTMTEGTRGLAYPFLAVWVLLGFAAMHIRQQFNDSRAHLLPHFRRVHATVAVAVLLVPAVLLPLAGVWLWGLRPVGLPAAALVLTGLIFWGTVTKSHVLGTLPILVFLGLSSDSARQAAERFISGGQEFWAYAALGAGLVASITGAMRLMSFRDDERPSGAAPRARQGASAGQMSQAGWVAPLPRGWHDWLVERHVARVIRHVRRAEGSRWSRVCRWRAGIMAATTIWGFGLLVIGYAQACSMLMSTPWTFAFVSPVFLAPAVMSTWYRRAAMWGYESLLPVRRADYVRQMGLAAILWQFEFWAVLTGLSVAWTLVASSKPIAPGTALMLIAVSSLLQVWMFGVVAWFLQYRTQFSWMIGMILALTVAPPLLGSVDAGGAHARPVVLGVAGLLAILGAALAAAAYRRWLVVDLD